MTVVIDISARARNRPAAIQRLQAIHDSRHVFDELRRLRRLRGEPFRAANTKLEDSDLIFFRAVIC